MEGGVLRLFDCELRLCHAEVGAGLHAVGGVVSITGTLFEGNAASLSGGGISVGSGGSVELSNQTQLQGNLAPSGRSLHIDDGASVRYLLPARLGHWVFITNSMHSHSDLSSVTSMDDNYPFACSGEQMPPHSISQQFTN